MTKPTITIIALASILFSATIVPHPVFAGEIQSREAADNPLQNAIPPWVDQNFKWYGEGLIEQSELLNAIKFLIEAEIMILEPKSHAEDNAPIESGKLLETAKSNPDLFNPDLLNPDILNSHQAASKLVGELLDNGAGTEEEWTQVIDQLGAQSPETTDSVAEDLQGVIVLCSTAIDKEIFALQGEISLLQELSEMHVSETSDGAAEYAEDNEIHKWITEKTSRIDEKIQSLQTGLMVLEERLAGVGDDAQLANIDLQNALQKQQQTLQTMSNVSKMLHDTAMAVIRKIG